jgi:hypothetical protein
VPKCLIICALAAVGTLVLVSLGGEKPRVARESLFYAQLPDGSELNLRTPSVNSPTEGEVSDVNIALYGKPISESWEVEKVTSVHRLRKAEDYYALVKVFRDRLFIFFLWNGHYCTIDRKTGAILASGNGDDELRKFDELLPLKLSTTSTFHFGPYRPLGTAGRKGRTNNTP